MHPQLNIHKPHLPEFWHSHLAGHQPHCLQSAGPLRPRARRPRAVDRPAAAVAAGAAGGAAAAAAAAPAGELTVAGRGARGVVRRFGFGSLNVLEVREVFSGFMLIQHIVMYMLFAYLQHLVGVVFFSLWMNPSRFH